MKILLEHFLCDVWNLYVKKYLSKLGYENPNSSIYVYFGWFKLVLKFCFEMVCFG